MQLSPQQSAVIDWTVNGKGSAFVEATAGSGKTTLLIEMLVATKGSVGFTAYNKKIATEIEQKLANKADPKHAEYDPRFAGIGNRVRVGTFHSFGYGAWRRVHGDVKLDAKAKEQSTAEALCIPRQFLTIVSKLISLAKQRAIGLFGSIDDKSLWYDIVDHFDLTAEMDDTLALDRVVELAIAGLKHHIAIGDKLIDFDDMIYLPVTAGIRMWENEWIFVDEAQDTNPARRALARKMLRSNGRAVFVGDRHQAIYGFTGADADAIDQIVRDFHAAIMPLSVSWRCPQLVVAEAQQVVKHIQAAPTAPQGTVLDMHIEQWEKLMKGKQQETGLASGGLSASDAILCRNTKPLVQTAYKLIRNGIPCHVEGKDIGVGLIKLVNKYSVRSLDDLREKLERYLETQVAKLVAKGRETMADALQDRVETVFVIADECKTVDELRAKVAEMFLDAEQERKPTLTLSTIHKSKGREWNRVFLMGRFQLMPSKWARQAWQLEQEDNLVYVGVTRAKAELIYVPAPEKEEAAK